MRSLYLLLFSSLLLSLTNSISALHPLIFNPYTLEIYNVRGMTHKNKNKMMFATACPANKNEFEKDFNKKSSYGQKSLLMVTLDDEYRKAQKTNCEKSFELSIVTVDPHIPHEDIYRIDLGYEVYYDRSEYIPRTFNDKYYNEFGTISEIKEKSVPFLSKERMTKSLKKLWSPTLVKEIEGKKYSKKMDLIWLQQIAIWYNAPLRSIIGVNYKLYRNADQLLANLKCENFDLGSELYKSGPLDKFYEPENQEKIFTDLRLPESISPNGNCKMKLVCLKKYNLVPAYAFQASTASIVSCSNLTSVPIWYEVMAPLLDYLDKFLMAMAQITDNRLVIKSGVFDILKLKHDDLEDSQSKAIYLHSEEHKLPVPKIVYKIVTYAVLPFDPKKEESAFKVAIVIHNEPDFDNDDKLCKEDKCMVWGWDSIQYQSTTDKDEGKKSRNIYCCELDEKFVEKIQWESESPSAGLDLTNFPHFDTNTRIGRFLNKQAKFEKIMEELFPSSGSADPTGIPNFIFEENPAKNVT